MINAKQIAHWIEDQLWQYKEGTGALWYFGLTKIPLLVATTPKVEQLTPQQCAIRIPLNFMTKNHLGSMYFGVLAIGADAAGGLMAMQKIRDRAPGKINLVFKDFKANYLRRPDGDVIFTCNQGELIDAMIEECLKTGERVTCQLRIEAFVEDSSEPVADFELGLSLKIKDE